MRHYINRFKRGYAWEARAGATHPLGRLAFSLLFVAFLFVLASDTPGYVMSAVAGIILLGIWVGVTINGSLWAIDEVKKVDDE